MEKNILFDLQAHLLPGMDHGCDDLTMLIAQLNIATRTEVKDTDDNGKEVIFTWLMLV